MIYAIWDYSEEDWVRELPSTVDDGGTAILAFNSKAAGQSRTLEMMR